MKKIFKSAGFSALAVGLLALGGGTGVPAAHAEERASSGASIVEHTVREGDNLSLMAGYYYGDPRQWRTIYDLNRDSLSDPRIIFPGTVLKVKGDPGRQWKMTYTDFLSRVFR